MSAEDIAVARARYPDTTFEVMDASQLKFDDQSFDECYAMDVLEHVDDLDAVISEMTRVLKPGGKLVVNVPAEASERWLLKLRPTYFQEIHHVRIFTGTELEDRVCQAGYVALTRRPRGVMQHIELYILFTRTKSSEKQLGIGHWRDSPVTMAAKLFVLYFDPVVLKTPAKWLPLWIVTLPLGIVIDRVGSAFFPKSIYHEFRKL